MNPVTKVRQDPKYCYIREMAVYLETEMIGVGSLGTASISWSDGRKQCSEFGKCTEDCIWAQGSLKSNRDGMVRLPEDETPTH